MPTFFMNNGNGQVGRAVGCQDPAAAGTMRFISLEPALTWRAHTSIITRITVSHQGNFQFLHTIGNDVYIYVFGDRIGQVTISGLSMTKNCGAGGDGMHGFEKILRWYKENRIAQRKAPVVVSIGQTPIEGFVVGLTGDAIDPATRIIQYGLQLAVMPEKR